MTERFLQWIWLSRFLATNLTFPSPGTFGSSASNAAKSVIRARIEHVFADQKSQTRLFIRTIGIIWIKMKKGLANIVYNMRRSLFLEWISASA